MIFEIKDGNGKKEEYTVPHVSNVEFLVLSFTILNFILI